MSSMTRALPRRMAREDGSSGPALSRGTLATVAGLSLVAAAIHVKVAPEHFGEWWGYGAFFVVSAIAELALVWMLARRPAQWVVQAGIWGSLATLLMYLVSRTAGIPVGPEAGVVEEVEALGIVASCAEAALLVLLCGLLGERSRSVTLTALAVAGALLWVAASAGALTPAASATAHEHGAHGGHGVVASPHASHSNQPLPVIPDSVRNAPRRPRPPPPPGPPRGPGAPGGPGPAPPGPAGGGGRPAPRRRGGGRSCS